MRTETIKGVDWREVLESSGWRQAKGTKMIDGYRVSWGRENWPEAKGVWFAVAGAVGNGALVLELTDGRVEARSTLPVEGVTVASVVGEVAADVMDVLDRAASVVQDEWPAWMDKGENGNAQRLISQAKSFAGARAALWERRLNARAGEVAAVNGPGEDMARKFLNTQQEQAKLAGFMDRMGGGK